MKSSATHEYYSSPEVEVMEVKVTGRITAGSDTNTESLEEETPGWGWEAN